MLESLPEYQTEQEPIHILDMTISYFSSEGLPLLVQQNHSKFMDM